MAKYDVPLKQGEDFNFKSIDAFKLQKIRGRIGKQTRNCSFRTKKPERKFWHL
jgi:hypothetical protein